MYSSAEEFQCLIKEVLSWDIRSSSQQSQLHHQGLEVESNVKSDTVENGGGSDLYEPADDTVTYHLVLEGICVSYKIDCYSNVKVERADLVTTSKNPSNYQLNHSNWRAMMAHLHQ